MDQNMGRIIQYLKDKGPYTNGGSVEVSHAVNASLRDGKDTSLEGGLRVPMIISWPLTL
jgi:arylsulfatase A-like enzyme